MGLIDSTYSPTSRRQQDSTEDLPMVGQILVQKTSLIRDMKSLIVDLESATDEDPVEETYFRRRWNSPEHIEAVVSARKGHEATAWRP